MGCEDRTGNHPAQFQHQPHQEAGRQARARGLADWQSFSRNVRADFRRAFRARPGEIEGVGLMTDTDSLGGKAEACYADVSLR